MPFTERTLTKLRALHDELSETGLSPSVLRKKYGVSGSQWSAYKRQIKAQHDDNNDDDSSSSRGPQIQTHDLSPLTLRHRPGPKPKAASNKYILILVEGELNLKAALESLR